MSDRTDLTCMMHCIVENFKTLMEQRWEIWRLKLDLCLRSALLEDQNLISREAMMRVFGNGSQWQDCSMCSLSKVESGNRFRFLPQEIDALCKEIGVACCRDDEQVSVQADALLESVKCVLHWKCVD